MIDNLWRGYKMKIKSKIVLFTCIICIVSVFLVFLINYKSTAGKLLSEMEDNSRNSAKIIGKEIDQWLSIQKNSLKEIASSLEYNDDFEFEYVHNYLKKQTELNEGNIYYLDYLVEKQYLELIIYHQKILIVLKESGIRMQRAPMM